MKVRFTLSIGLQGKKEEEFEYDYSDIEGKTPEEVNAWLDDEWKYWSSNYIDGSASIVDES